VCLAFGQLVFIGTLQKLSSINRTIFKTETK
jgi:hypothetical protein